jgi:alpha-1,2-mannosyltransferase
VGIGLAAAVKLTPGIFLIYLLLSRRWRAAIVAAATTFAATALAAVVAPDATRTYFTELMWDTSRIGSLDYVSNQSLLGLVSRHAGGSRVLWLCLVLLVLFIWGYRVRRTDVQTGFALTGVVACLVSPITWVHHLVWLAPGLVLLARKESTRRLAIWCYLLLVSCLVWIWSLNYHAPLGFLGANAYVFVSIAMLGALAAPLPVPAFARDLVLLRRARRLSDAVRARRLSAAVRASWLSAAVRASRLSAAVRASRLSAAVRASRLSAAARASRLSHPASHLVASSPNDPASQWSPTMQVLASAHARHLR